eukprot:TRINITY_DN41245_c0_g1_i1.p1 TRINITY_DN41245_c0_g1~~TRINITY_DN41245_c0_g1_i1.p1  ORF type:complete len:277 (+),score=52.41 TRINITY_DN41245_c0_g1_i1:69-899(+)
MPSPGRASCLLAAWLVLARLDAAQAVRSTSTGGAGLEVAAMEAERLMLEDLERWQAQRRSRKPSRILQAFRWVLSGLGGYPDASFYEKAAKHDVLQEHVAALQGAGIWKGMCDHGHQLDVAPNSNASLLQLHLESRETAYLHKIAKVVLEDLRGNDTDPGDNIPRMQEEADLPPNVTSSFREKMQKAWLYFPSRTGVAHDILNIVTSLVGLDPNRVCAFKLLYSFTSFEEEDDYPYFPKGCIDNFAEVLTGGAQSATSHVPLLVALLMLAISSLWA